MNTWTEFDIPYAQVDGRELVLRITKPVGQGPGPFPVLLDFHGGAWTHFDHRVDLAWCRELAKSGVMCASVQFRLAPEHPWPAFIADARAALRWITANGSLIGADTMRIGTIGGSTGGFLSILLALCPRTENETVTHAIDTPDDLVPVSPRVAIGFYPILDVVGRYDMVLEKQQEFSGATRWLRRRVGPAQENRAAHMASPVDRLDSLYTLKQRDGLAGVAARAAGEIANAALALASRVPVMQLTVFEELQRNHEGAFASRSAMHEASPLARVEEQRIQRKPAILIVQGLADINVTEAMTRRFADAYARQGGDIECEFPANFPHAFASLPSRQSDTAIARAKQFLAMHGMLDGIPADSGAGVPA